MLLLIPGTHLICTVILLFHKEMAHISVCAYGDKSVSSINAGFGELQSQSTMLSAESWSNKENFSLFFWLRTDQFSPGLSLLLSSTPLHFSIPDATPDGQHYHIYQKGDSVYVTLQLDNWSAHAEMWRNCNKRKRHKYINRGIGTEWSNNMCLGILFKVNYGIELKL